MALPIKKYHIGKNRLLRGCMEGFAVLTDGALVTTGKGQHIFFLGRLDSNQPDCEWGRLRFETQSDDSAVVVVHAFASNNTEIVGGGALLSCDGFLLDQQQPTSRKRKLFEAAGASRFMGKTDVLLYEQTGRYLWICLEIIGGTGVKLRNLTVYAPRDNFYSTFPEVYRDENNFFHRYLSIFSSLYYDLQDTVDHLDRYVDVDTAPYEALPALAGWLGIELDGNFLDEVHLRKLLKSAFVLFQAKGTRRAVETILRVFVDVPFYIVEQRVLLENLSGAERAIYERLYGQSPFDYTVMICCRADERLHAQLKFLMRQFTLLRSRVNIVFLEKESRTDSFCYLDVNASILESVGGAFDSGMTMGDMSYLQ